MRNVIVFAAALLFATAAAAQTTGVPQAAPANGPLVLEQIHDGWILAPDFKVTDFDSRTGELAGVYGGRLIDGTILIGGAGYGLTNERSDFKLGYGGLVLGLQTPEMGRIRFGARALVGAGRATLGFNITTLRGVPLDMSPGGRAGDIRFGVANTGAPQAPSPSMRAPLSVQTVQARALGRDDFMVFEPQANISARVTHAVGVSCGVSYRVASETDILRNRLNGPSASLAVQFGW